jgi:hypothetical protein
VVRARDALPPPRGLWPVNTPTREIGAAITTPGMTDPMAQPGFKRGGKNMSAQDTIHKKSFADTSVCRRGKRSTWLNGEAVLLRGSRLAAITAVSGLLASGVAIMFA